MKKINENTFVEEEFDVDAYVANLLATQFGDEELEKDQLDWDREETMHELKTNLRY